MPDPRPIKLRAEQAVYGSFPFREQGYGLLVASPGCRPEWLAEFRAACEGYGERPREASGEGMFALRLESGPWLIVGVIDSGVDDRGRPGALAFHGLFVANRDYRRLGAWPFALSPHHRRDWGPEDAARGLAPLTIEAGPASPAGPSSAEATRIAGAIAGGRRVAVESAGPIEALAREVWAALPERARRRATLATRAFAEGAGFDLLGLPPRGRSRLDPAAGYLDPADLVAIEPGRRSKRRRPAGLLAAAVALTLAAGLYAASGRVGTRATPAVDVPEGRALAPAPGDSDPPPPVEGSEPPDAEIAARVTAGLVELAEWFGAAAPGEFPAGSDPAAVMERIAGRLRYRGPMLSDAELARLRAERGPGRGRALEWDAHVRRFRPDRPLPPGFDRGPLRWQLDTLAWSFRVEPDPTLAPAEVPPALAHALAVEGPIAPNPLAGRHPALGAYARFLATLPRR